MVLAKVIMVAGMLHFGRSLENKPLILLTLYRTVMFTLWVALFAAVESAIRGFLHGKGLEEVLDHLLSEGTHEFFAKCLVVFVAFIPFFATKELGRVLGKGKMWELFFRKGQAALAAQEDKEEARFLMRLADMIDLTVPAIIGKKKVVSETSDTQ